MFCVCGSTEFQNATKRVGLVVRPEGRTDLCEITVVECKKCGLIRQTNLPFNTIQEYIDYYKRYPPVTERYTVKDYQHDRKVAIDRINAYDLRSGMKVLDVGCGSGAFIAECRSRGIEAVGCEIAIYKSGDPKNEEFIYYSSLEDIHFPTDHFDVVTCHDVLEHVIDPLDFLFEMARITKQLGTCIIEIPNFFSKNGEHHWKKDEHIWFFSQEQLERFASEAGFVVTDSENPIPSKTRVYLSKPVQRRTKILLPPGIGDSYWSIVKLESFIEKYQTGLPDIYIACNRDRKYNGNNRAFPFIEMFPFLHSSGISISNTTHPSLRPIWKEAYAQMGRTIFKKVFGCDYFISYNGHLRFGKQLEEVDPDLRCNWIPPMFVSLEQERFRRKMREQYGKYIAYFFVFQGTYKYWVDEFPIRKVIESVNKMTELTGFRPVITGALWDKDDQMLNAVTKNIPSIIDLRGETTVEQLFGLMRGAEAVVGYPSGSTIMGAVLGTKTLIIWNDYYNKDFAWYCAPPSTRNTNYKIEVTRKLTPDKLVGRIHDLLGMPYTPEVPKVKRPKPVKTKVLTPTETPVVVASVLKAAYYTRDEVIALKAMVDKQLTVDHSFVLLTDTDFEWKGITTYPLNMDLPYPWCKLELFRNDLRTQVFKDATVLFFDLNLMIVGNIDELALFNHEFSMLTSYGPHIGKAGSWSPDVMAWKGDFNRLLDRYIRRVGVLPVNSLLGLFISNHLGKELNSIQLIQRGVYSYKKHCSKGLPEDASIVWFHGYPNYTEVPDSWVTERVTRIRSREDEDDDECDTEVEEVRTNQGEELGQGEVPPETGIVDKDAERDCLQSGVLKCGTT